MFAEESKKGEETLKKIKAVIFDFGGVFSSDTSLFIIRDLANSFNVSEQKVRKWFDNKLFKEYEKGNLCEEEFWRRMSKLTGRPLPNNYKQLLLRQYKKHSRTNKNMRNLAEYLKKKGYKTAVLSNTIPTHINFNLAEGRYSMFDVVVLSPQVHHTKPEREIYKEALRKLRVKPEEAVFTDDKLEYVNAARKMGIHALQFKSYPQFFGELKKLIPLDIESLNHKDLVE